MDQGDRPTVRPEEVLSLTAPTADFLCSLKANRYGIEFLEFRIQEQESKRVMFELRNAAGAGPYVSPTLPPEVEDELRTVRYNFPASFLRNRTVRTLLSFKVGDQPVPNFRMIERHYFRGKLIRSFDFPFGFCIPGSTNSWEAVYETPELSEADVQEFVSSPGEHVADTFYFVGDELVMQNKAVFSYENDGEPAFH